MPKFYVQSENVSLVTSADNAEQAACWGVNRAIDMYFPVDDLECHLITKDSFYFLLKGLAELDTQVAISQIGHGRLESGLFETEFLLKSWRRRSCRMGFHFGQLRLNPIGEIDKYE